MGFLCQVCHVTTFIYGNQTKDRAGCIFWRKEFDNSMGLTLQIFFYQIECCKKRVDKCEAGHKGGIIFKEQSTPPIQGCHCCTFKDGGWERGESCVGILDGVTQGIEWPEMEKKKKRHRWRRRRLNVLSSLLLCQRRQKNAKNNAKNLNIANTFLRCKKNFASFTTSASV